VDRWDRERCGHGWLYSSTKRSSSAANSSIVVAVLHDGARLDVPIAEGESLFAALLRQGVAQPWSCRTGSCHSCLADVLDTRQLRPPSVLEAERPGTPARVLACQACLVQEAGH
jgi:ferredoxin